jgi:hypothetical protein
MNRLVGLAAVVAAVLGFWAGVSAWQSPGGWTNLLAGAAILLAGNLLLFVWLWRRARPGSGDAMVLPLVGVSSGGMLLGILPRLFWPAAEDIQIAGSIASVLVVTVLLVIQVRNRRKFRRVP